MDGLPGAPPPGRAGEATQDLAGALHEVSNALTVIVGWIDRARDEQGVDRGRALDVVAARARDARRIVRRAIGAELPGSGGDPAPTRPHDPPRTLRDVIDDALTGIEPEARRREMPLRAALEPGAAPRAVQDGAVVVQILTNLLLNAIALSPPGGAVTVDARLDGEGVLLGVADEGPGVPVERRATLLSAGVSTRPGGAGIGLRHSAALAEAAGGALSLAPSPQGARFELRWPSLPADGAAPSSQIGDLDPGEGSRPEAPPDSMATRGDASAPGGAVLEGIRILLVEDDEAVVDLLDTALTARGASIISVRTVVDLPGALASGPFHVALLDLSPIEGDVLGTVSAVRSASPHARLVVMSGSVGTAPELPIECSAAWVRKPFEIRELVEALTR